MCTCGRTDPHVIARRRTADGFTVCAWSDGPVTAELGRKIDGLPIVRPTTPEAIELARRAAWLLLGEACLWDLSDMARLYSVCRAVAKRSGLPDDVRAGMSAPRLPPLAWRTTDTDRDGRPTERVVVLPRLRWPGVAVFDFCGSTGSARGRYALHTRIGPSTYAPTGFAFSTIAALWAHLEQRA